MQPTVICARLLFSKILNDQFLDYYITVFAPDAVSHNKRQVSFAPKAVTNMCFSSSQNNKIVNLVKVLQNFKVLFFTN